MKVYRLALVAIALGSLCGCAVMDPYIRYQSLTRLASKVSGCTNPLPHQGENAALSFACRAAVRLESARSEVVRTRSGLTATLFPIAGIVGYNSARGFNAPTNAALTAGGLAGYSAVTTLAQQDRVHIYDNGLRSVSCAIGVYEMASPGGSSAALRRTTIRSEINGSLATIAAIRTATNDMLVIAKLDGLKAILAELRRAVEHLNSAAPLDAQLVALVHNTLAEVNAQLSQTLPSNADAFDGAVGVLRAGQAEKPAIDSAEKAVEGMMLDLNRPAFRARKQIAPASGDSVSVGSLLDELDGRLQRIFEGLEALALESEQVSAADFTKCKYDAVANLNVRPPTQQLMLGAGDSQNEMPITLQPKGASEIRIFGGSPPYEAGRTGPESTMKVEIVSKGGAPYLSIVAPEHPPDVEQSHVITLTDSGGWQSKRVPVKLPGK